MASFPKIRLRRILHIHASVFLLQFQLFAAEDITCNGLVNIVSVGMSGNYRD